MADNQQIQNVKTALEAADGVSVDADLTAESVTIEDANGDTLEISNAGAISVSDDGNFEVDIISDTVTVEDNGNFEVSDVLSTLTVSDDGNFEVDLVTDTVTVEEPPGANGSFGSTAVGTTATEVLTATTGRKSLLVQNAGSGPVYVGFDNTVTTANGVEIAAGGTYADETYSGSVYVIAASGTQDIRFQEVTV